MIIRQYNAVFREIKADFAKKKPMETDNFPCKSDKTAILFILFDPCRSAGWPGRRQAGFRIRCRMESKTNCRLFFILFYISISMLNMNCVPVRVSDSKQKSTENVRVSGKRGLKGLFPSEGGLKVNGQNPEKQEEKTGIFFDVQENKTVPLWNWPLE